MDILVYVKEEKTHRLITSALGEAAVFVKELPDVQKAIGRNRFKVILIDLEDGEEDGMRMAHYLRGIHRYYLTPVVFLAKDDRCKWQAYQKIRCYDYIYKPFKQRNLRETINLLCNKLDPEHIPKGLVIRSRAEIYRFEISDILFVEILNKNLILHTIYGIWEFPYHSIGECIAQGRGELIQCHRAMAVNRRYVKRIDYMNRSIILENTSEQVLLGPKFMQGIRNLFDAGKGNEYT